MFASIENGNEKFASYRTIPEKPKFIPLYSFGERLFSMMTPSYERYLMEEIYGLRCVVKFTLDEIMDMPIADRRLFIQLHNQRIEKENNAMSDNSSTKENIDDVKDLVNKANTQKQK
ncbi:MAG: hypothetical protein FWC41_05520 [Firmicutes bacterium]|nr:hypothetical protein [Bacillota bacterium]